MLRVVAGVFIYGQTLSCFYNESIQSFNSVDTQWSKVGIKTLQMLEYRIRLAPKPDVKHYGRTNTVRLQKLKIDH